MNHKIKLVNNDAEKRFEIWEGEEMKLSITPNQFADLMLEIKAFIEKRNPEQVRKMREKNHRRIIRSVFWMTVRMRFFQAAQSLLDKVESVFRKQSEK